MKTFTLNLKLFGSCLTCIVSLPTCSIILSVASLIICSTLSPLFTQLLRKLSISVFPSLAYTLFKFAIKSPDFAVLLIHILTFDLFFAPRFVFRSSTRISSFFPFKDKVPKLMRSGVVYLFKCRCCSASYVGQTTHHLHTRISEHLGISPITGKPSSNPVMSSIFSHLNSTGHSANFDDFEILFSCSDTCELMIHESLLISKLKPSLNVQGSSIPLNLL